jgi:putative selenium metabolism protein SsnA
MGLEGEQMLITNGTLVTGGQDNQILSDHAIYVHEGVIADIGRTRDLIDKYPYVERLDARRQLVMPGNICAHTHFYGAYARGMAIPGEPPKDFPEILHRLWWNLDKALDKDSVRASALVCLVDAIKHGTTTLFDHHASPNFIEGSLDVIADAVNQAGLRAVLCYEVTDRDGIDKAEAGIAENVRAIKKYAAHPRIGAIFGLHASLSLSDETLRKCVDANVRADSEYGFHIHVAEHETDEQDSLQKYGKRVIHRLNDHGVLGMQTILAHCVHVDAAEIELIEESGAVITHQPRSNMNNAVGAMNLDALLARDILLCLGNDGFSNAMWEEWKAAYLLHKVVSRDPRKANGAVIAQMAMENNRLLASAWFESLNGIYVGAAADLIFIDYHPFTPLTAGNLPWHVIFGFESSMVTTTMVDGVVLMRDHVLLTLDERAIAEEAMALAPSVWERYARYAAGAVQ